MDQLASVMEDIGARSAKRSSSGQRSVRSLRNTARRNPNPHAHRREPNGTTRSTVAPIGRSESGLPIGVQIIGGSLR
jgi:hypothetical protein